MAPRKKKTNTQKITLDHIIQDNKKFEELVEIKFTDGRFTEIYKHFSNPKIDEMIRDLSNFLIEYEKNIGSFDTDKIIDYVNLHTLIHFSTILDPSTHLTFENKINIFEQLQKSDLVEKIFESFEKTEIEKIFTRMWKKLEAYQETLKNNKDMRDKLKEHIQNSDMQNKNIIMDVMFGEKEDGEQGLQ